MSYFKKLLRDNGFKATAARLAVLDVLDNTQAPVSASDIFQKIGKGTFDLATLYRILSALVSKGIVHEIDLKRGHALYELVEDGHHHHHLVCKKCSKVVDLNDCILPGVEQRVVSKNGFASIQEHSLEFYGICINCVSL